MDGYKERYNYQRLRAANNRKVAILGSGLVALVAHKIIDNSIIITKKRNPLYLNNVYVHDTIENRSFLKLFAGASLKKIEVPFYYFNAKTTELKTSISDDDRLTLIREKMGNIEMQISDISISTTKNNDEKFFVLDFNATELEEKLFRNADVIEMPIVKVEERANCVRVYFDNSIYMDYDYVINTIPQNFFQEFLPEYENRKYESIPLTFVTPSKTVYPEIHDRDYMIYAFNNCNWKRIFTKAGRQMIEYNGSDISQEQIVSDFPQIKTFKRNVLPYGRIVSNKVVDGYRIINVGRFAEWNHEITLEHTLNKLLNLNL